MIPFPLPDLDPAGMRVIAFPSGDRYAHVEDVARFLEMAARVLRPEAEIEAHTLEAAAEELRELVEQAE